MAAADVTDRHAPCREAALYSLSGKVPAPTGEWTEDSVMGRDRVGDLITRWLADGTEPHLCGDR